MAKDSSFLRLAMGLLALLSCALAVELSDVFTVQDGTTDGGCDGRSAVLDDWLTETLYSVDAAIAAIEVYNQDVRVRRAMSTIFGIANRGRATPGTATGDAIDAISTNLGHIKNFFEGSDEYNSDDYWFFCDSTFLSLEEPTSPALDYEANEIRDQNGNPVPIEDVPVYQEKLAEDADSRPWWSGDLTTLNGYYFTDHGANYCYGDDLGVTAAIQTLARGPDGHAVAQPEKASVIICPYSFDGSPRPDSYRDANGLLAQGTNLADAVPKSATLLHEAFHTIFGDAFLSGGEELYDIASCLDLANSDPGSARANPENYVYFVAQMYHMRGEEEGDEPWSIPTQWDFRFSGAGRNRIYGAFHNPA